MSNLVNGSWWQIAIINVYNCKKEKLTDKDYLKQFAAKLCKQIDMTPHGEPMIQRFGVWDLEWYSMLQFIETSSITVHLDEFGDRAFVDIFSCKEFDSEAAAIFTKQYFAGAEFTHKTIYRK